MGGPGPGMSQAWAAQGRSEQVSSAQGRSEQVSSKATGLSVAEKIPGGGQVGADEDDAYMCVICYDEMAFAADGQSISLPCGHMFHLGCIKEWLQRDACCPTCKSEVPGVLNRDQMPLMGMRLPLGCAQLLPAQPVISISIALAQSASPARPSPLIPAASDPQQRRRLVLLTPAPACLADPPQSLSCPPSFFRIIL